MFVYTAKLSKEKLAIALLAVLVIVAVIVLVFSGGKEPAEETISIGGNARTAKQRVQYLENLGWLVESEPIESETVVIPAEFSGVYADYEKLQDAQGFDLEKYSGKECTRYTYRVLNYPGAEDPVVADIIVYRGKVIAGDVQSTRLDGFMQGLDYPETA